VVYGLSILLDKGFNAFEGAVAYLADVPFGTSLELTDLI
jgi:hypothetical protein